MSKNVLTVKDIISNCNKMGYYNVWKDFIGGFLGVPETHFITFIYNQKKQRLDVCFDDEYGHMIPDMSINIYSLNQKINVIKIFKKFCWIEQLI